MIEESGDQVFDNVDEVLTGKIIEHTRKSAGEKPGHVDEMLQYEKNPEGNASSDYSRPSDNSSHIKLLSLAFVFFILCLIVLVFSHSGKNHRKRK